MERVITTDFSTPCCAKTADAVARVWAGLHRACAALLLGVLLALLGWCVGPRVAQAQQITPEISAMQVMRSDEGLQLSANLRFDLPLPIEDALRQGIPMYFVAEAVVRKERWYWSDQEVGTARRYYRLSHQPLTRRWRLYVSNTAFSSAGAGLSLGQSFEHLDDALAAIQRIYRWQIMDEPLNSVAGVSVQLRFRLDLTQLPRPLQIGVLGRSGWNLQIARTQLLEAEP